MCVGFSPESYCRTKKIGAIVEPPFDLFKFDFDRFRIGRGLVEMAMKGRGCKKVPLPKRVCGF